MKRRYQDTWRTSLIILRERKKESLTGVWLIPFREIFFWFTIIFSFQKKEKDIFIYRTRPTIRLLFLLTCLRLFLTFLNVHSYQLWFLKMRGQSIYRFSKKCLLKIKKLFSFSLGTLIKFLMNALILRRSKYSQLIRLLWRTTSSFGS